ncbi:MAG: hypothetical protein NZ651_04730 [Candidatus Bipolaricaulota bacterium]|nr:hypothetical protein [Candidatus Bipolaricaulota bacterium]MDW8127058.1 hypothetical protein [Candidatus Bipolaricaulota bacterium]
MTKVLEDTSVWIEFYHPRGAGTVKEALAQALEAQDAVLSPWGVPSHRDLKARV